VIHCAAVSDYLAAGVYAPREGTTFQREEGQGVGHWSGGETPPTLVDRQAGKIKSDEAELWVRLVRAPKLVDRIRNPWGFQGQLVKFKLEVGVSDEELLDIAERSRVHSRADLLVANTLENAAFYAFLGPLDGKYERLARRNLAGRLVDALEQRHKPHEEGPRRG
jgi:phosphopantothenoylcysteine synthetase/decarboxylase